MNILTLLKIPGVSHVLVALVTMATIKLIDKLLAPAEVSKLLSLSNPVDKATVQAMVKSLLPKLMAIDPATASAKVSAMIIGRFPELSLEEPILQAMINEVLIDLQKNIAAESK